MTADEIRWTIISVTVAALALWMLLSVLGKRTSRGVHVIRGRMHRHHTPPSASLDPPPPFCNHLWTAPPARDGFDEDGRHWCQEWATHVAEGAPHRCCCNATQPVGTFVKGEQ